MAQHIPIEVFPQKVVQTMANNIRKRNIFAGSLMWEELPEDYNETENDKVYFGERTVPVSVISYGKACIEVHTEPVEGRPPIFRKVTNIYVVA